MGHSGRSKHGPPTLLLLTIGVPAILVFLCIEKVVVLGSMGLKRVKKKMNCITLNNHTHENKGGDDIKKNEETQKKEVMFTPIEEFDFGEGSEMYDDSYDEIDTSDDGDGWGNLGR